MKPGYKQTEVGVIPEDWRLERLGTICDVRDGTHDSPRFFETGVPFVTSKNIVNGQIDLTNVSHISEVDAFEFDKRSKVDRNDIIMSMIGTIGSAVLVDFDPKFCIKNVALIKPPKVGPPYLIHHINSPSFQRYLESNLEMWSVWNGAKLRHFWDGFGFGFFTGSGSGFEKDFLANGTHFFEDGFELLVGSDSLFQKVGLFLRE